VEIRTKRWNDAVEPEDGYRLLICRYRPRGVRKTAEPWDAWCPALAPSPALHAAWYGKTGPGLTFEEYERRFRGEMRTSGYWLAGFADRVKRGESLTLLCSSACSDPALCHRTIVKQLLEALAAPPEPVAARGRVLRRSGG